MLPKRQTEVAEEAPPAKKTKKEKTKETAKHSEELARSISSKATAKDYLNYYK